MTGSLWARRDLRKEVEPYSAFSPHINSSLAMVMSWCLRMLRIVWNLMNTCSSNLQIPIAVLGCRGSGSNGGAHSCCSGFHATSKGCVKQDDGCCKGQRPQTVCHHHQSPRKLTVASLSTLSWQITSDALQEGSTFWKECSSN